MCTLCGLRSCSLSHLHKKDLCPLLPPAGLVEEGEVIVSKLEVFLVVKGATEKFAGEVDTSRHIPASLVSAMSQLARSMSGNRMKYTSSSTS